MQMMGQKEIPFYIHIVWTFVESRKPSCQKRKTTFSAKPVERMWVGRARTCLETVREYLNEIKNCF